MLKRSEGMRTLCAALLAYYNEHGPFNISACDTVTPTEPRRELIRMRFHKALHAGFFEVVDCPDGKKKSRIFKPGPNIMECLTGETTQKEPERPALCDYFGGMRLPENFHLPHPGSHIHKTPWE